jgi:hypothetical protein
MKLGRITADQILSELQLGQGTVSKSLIRAVARAGDDTGLIGPHAAMEFYGRGDPRKHTYTDVRTVLLDLGCVDKEPRYHAWD